MSTPFSVPDSRTSEPNNATTRNVNGTLIADVQPCSNPKSNEIVQWNYDIPLPWTKEQTEAWEALIPRSIPMVLKMTRT